MIPKNKDAAYSQFAAYNEYSSMTISNGKANYKATFIVETLRVINNIILKITQIDIIWLLAGKWWCTFLNPAFGRQTQVDLCEFKDRESQNSKKKNYIKDITIMNVKNIKDKYLEK